MGIFKPGSSNDPRRKAAVWNVTIVIAMVTITIALLYSTFEAEDPCADRTNLTVEQVWACNGVKPEGRE